MGWPLQITVGKRGLENGIMWPMSIAPAHVCIIPLTVDDDEVHPTANRIANEIANLGFEVVVDDRKERPGVKFAEADLMGWPLQIIVGKRGLENGTVEVKLRRLNKKKDVQLSVLAELLSLAKTNIKAGRDIRIDG